MKQITRKELEQLIKDGAAVRSWAKDEGVPGEQNIVTVGISKHYLFKPEEVGGAEWKQAKTAQYKAWASDCVPAVFEWGKPHK